MKFPLSALLLLSLALPTARLFAAADDPRAACAAGTAWRLERLGARFVAAESLRAWLAHSEAVAAIVRPDRFVFGSANQFNRPINPGELPRQAIELPGCLDKMAGVKEGSAKDIRADKMQAKNLMAGKPQVNGGVKAAYGIGKMSKGGMMKRGK